jgi:hypothetical protein
MLVMDLVGSEGAIRLARGRPRKRRAAGKNLCAQQVRSDPGLSHGRALHNTHDVYRAMHAAAVLNAAAGREGAGRWVRCGNDNPDLCLGGRCYGAMYLCGAGPHPTSLPAPRGGRRP